MRPKKIKNVITKNFGVGDSTCMKLHKRLGLNIRKSPLNILSKHAKKLYSYYKQKTINNELKKTIEMYSEVKKKTQPIKLKNTINKKK